MKRFLTAMVVTLFALCLAMGAMLKGNGATLKTTGSAATSDIDASLVFDEHCDSCHGKNGQAKTFKAKFIHARNLTDAKWQAEVSDERIFNSIANGKSKMPAFGKKLSEEQINALVTYVRRLKK